MYVFIASCESFYDEGILAPVEKQALVCADSLYSIDRGERAVPIIILMIMIIIISSFGQSEQVAYGGDYQR